MYKTWKLHFSVKKIEVYDHESLVETIKTDINECVECRQKGINSNYTAYAYNHL